MKDFMPASSEFGSAPSDKKIFFGSHSLATNEGVSRQLLYCNLPDSGGM